MDNRSTRDPAQEGAPLAQDAPALRMSSTRSGSALPEFAEVVDQAPDAILLVDARGQIVYGNRAVKRLFGVEPGGLVGRSVETLMPGRYARGHATHRQAYERVPRVRAMGDVAGALMGRRADGSEFPVDVHLAPVARGSERWTLAVVRDATERHRILAEVQATRRAAEEVARVKGEFLGVAAHDLSQPVQTLELVCAALERGAPRGEFAELGALARISLTRMRELLKMLMEISRLESGHLEVDLQPVPIGEIFEYIERQFGPVARAKALALTAEPCDHIIEADPPLLRGMLSNLVSNAIRYTPRGEVRLRCEPRADGALRLAVGDTGIGIASEDLPRIFDDFERLSEAERLSREGFGLGLGIVRRLSGLLRFPVSVQSIVGQGSTFTVEIPPAKVLGTASRPASPPAARG